MTAVVLTGPLTQSIINDTKQCLRQGVVVYSLTTRKAVNPCHTVWITCKMPPPLLIISQSDCLIQVGDTNSHTKLQTLQILISLLLIRIYTACKGETYPGLTGPGLSLIVVSESVLSMKSRFGDRSGNRKSAVVFLEYNSGHRWFES